MSPEAVDKNAAPQYSAPEISFSRAQWMKLFNQGDHKALSKEFIRLIEHFIHYIYMILPADRRAFINDFVENFLYFFCHPEFKIPPDYIPFFIRLQPVIANIVAISDFGTTTPWVERLAQDRGSFFKLLTLYNVRTEIDIEAARLFDVNPMFASQWWTYFWTSAPAFCTKETHEKIRRHLESLDDRFELFGTNARISYFPVTYVAPERERVIKERINLLAARAFSNVKIRNSPKRNKIAVVSGRWYRSAVYTSLSPLIRSLAGAYDLTLVHFGTAEETIMDRELFERTVKLTMADHRMDLEPLQDNDFAAAIYPDIGMNAESIYLSNVRIAPIQIMMYGHPSSSWSPTVDYFIGGEKVENREKANENYGERLVLLPGMGVYPVYPDDFEVPPDEPGEGPLTISCGWTAQKVTFPALSALREVLAKVHKPVLFQFFVGRAMTEANGLIPFVKDVHAMLGPEHVRVVTALPRLDYLAELCRGAFSIDAYPFGGFNTVIDALWCKKPIVVWQGDRAFNRFGAATLDIAGMPELIARSKDEYVEKIVRCIDDDGYRAALVAQVKSVDLKAAFAKHIDPSYFRTAVDFLIENHDRLKADGSREPILIS